MLLRRVLQTVQVFDYVSLSQAQDVLYLGQHCSHFIIVVLVVSIDQEENK